MSKPIRILHVVDTLGKGGLENGLVNLIERLDHRSFEHTICAMRHLGVNADRLAGEQVRIMRLYKKTPSRIQMPALANAIREVKPDIVHSRNWGTIESVMAGRWVGGCALVHSEHGLDAEGVAGEPWRRRCFRRLAFELASRVLSVSHQLKNVHAKRTGFRADRITVIHNGVDSRRFYPNGEARTRLRGELGISDEFCVGCVGNLTPVKDHMTLFQAIREVAKVTRKWRLLLIGEGPERPKLESFASSYPEWKEHISFLGLRSDIPELLNAMDAFVLPSITEGISNAVLEAMASGLPAAVSETGGNPEVVVHGESGFLFPVGNHQQLAEQLLLLMRQKDLRQQLGKRAILRVRSEFSIDSMVQQYHKLYEEMMPALPMRAAVAV